MNVAREPDERSREGHRKHVMAADVDPGDAGRLSIEAQHPEAKAYRASLQEPGHGEDE